MRWLSGSTIGGNEMLERRHLDRVSMNHYATPASSP
jgi:hypothetical protein